MSLHLIKFLVAVVASARSVSGLRTLRGGLDPFDCYVDTGKDYMGLVKVTQGSKERPWCFTVTHGVEWEYCLVPKCKEPGAVPEPWVSPPGAKSAEAEAIGNPCTNPPPGPKFKEYKAGAACTDKLAETWWLVGMNKTEAADPEGCAKECRMLAGSEYFTFFGVKESGTNHNCGCYRECIPLAKDLTVHDPTIYRLT